MRLYKFLSYQPYNFGLRVKEGSAVDTWGDAVDADALGPQLARQRLGEANQRCLADGVHAERGGRVKGGEGGHEHHIAPLPMHGERRWVMGSQSFEK